MLSLLHLLQLARMRGCSLYLEPESPWLQRYLYKYFDFAEMMLHHGITAILTTFSYKIGHLRCGFVIILLHNVADPPLHLAKCLNYVCKRLGLQVRSRL